MQPENIVFVSNSPDSGVKVIDWGFAKRQQELQSLETPLFTDKCVLACPRWTTSIMPYHLYHSAIDQVASSYAPPEVAARLLSSAPGYTAACDLWSLGAAVHNHCC